LSVGVTALDTAYNYARFASHRILREVGEDLLQEFEISTKVGFFPDRHDLDPARLHAAVEQSIEHLGRRPDTVLLHNPESSPAGFLVGCEALAALQESGLCTRWGISTWDPRALARHSYAGPRPDVLMVRAGLMVPWEVLDAAEAVTTALRPRERWGMAPFGHDTSGSVWDAVDASIFLDPGRNATTIEAALAVAYSLPTVSRMAVGTTNSEHLRQLQHARLLDADLAIVARYRAMLRRKATLRPALSSLPLPGVRA
jgi:aryl-alcohol dehydrogenase-like predicted oxidoreductase